MRHHNDIAALTNELIYRRYLMTAGPLRQYFRELTVPEYIVLELLEEASEAGGPGRLYLTELADRMQLSIHQASHLVTALRDRGLLRWAHDGDGAEGTYMTMTPAGAAHKHRQEAALKDYYGRVIEAYGRDNTAQLLQRMAELENVMHDMEEETEGNRDV